MFIISMSKKSRVLDPDPAGSGFLNEVRYDCGFHKNVGTGSSLNVKG